MLIRTSRPRVYRANDLDVYKPEMWSEMGLMFLTESMVAANLVHRDFEADFAKPGDVVNAQRPIGFTANRKAKTSDIILQDATAETVPVKLNQQITVPFAIDDVDMSLSAVDLIAKYSRPAAIAMARRFDNVVHSATHRFRTNMAGNLSTSMGKATILAAREKLGTLNAPMEELFFLVNYPQETALLTLDEFTHVDKVGSTEGLRNASIGRRYGFDFYTCKNAPSVGSSSMPAAVTGAINGSGATAGATSLTVDGFTGDVAPAGAYITVAGDARPRRVVSSTLTLSNTTGIVIDSGLSADCADNAVVTVCGKALVNKSGGYANGYDEYITYDGAGSGKAPQVGQLVSFGSGTPEYSIVKVNANSDGTGTFETDRPLEAAVSDNDRINLGPTGSYGFAGHRNALALVVRPLHMPKAGVLSHSAIDPIAGSALRVSIQYDIYAQKTVVVFDALCGITVLDTDLGVNVMSNNFSAS